MYQKSTLKIIIWHIEKGVCQINCLECPSVQVPEYPSALRVSGALSTKVSKNLLSARVS